MLRAAAKLVSALVHAYPDQLSDIYSKAAGELVGRFREREENVKADVFAAYCDLLRQVRGGQGNSMPVCRSVRGQPLPPPPQQQMAVAMMPQRCL